MSFQRIIDVGTAPAITIATSITFGLGCQATSEMLNGIMGKSDPIEDCVNAVAMFAISTGLALMGGSLHSYNRNRAMIKGMKLIAALSCTTAGLVGVVAGMLSYVEPYRKELFNDYIQQVYDKCKSNLNDNLTREITFCESFLKCAKDYNPIWCKELIIK